MAQLNPYEPPRAEEFGAQAAALPVRVTGLVTADDSLAALKAVGKWRPWLLPLVVLPAVAWVIFVVTVERRELGRMLPVLVIVAGLFLLTFSIRAKRRYVKAFNARLEFQEPVTWTFSNEGLLSETSQSKTLRLWSGFAYAKITPNLVVLAQHGESMFNFIPRRLFETEGDWLAATQLLAAKIAIR